MPPRKPSFPGPPRPALTPMLMRCHLAERTLPQVTHLFMGNGNGGKSINRAARSLHHKPSPADCIFQSSDINTHGKPTGLLFHARVAVPVGKLGKRTAVQQDSCQSLKAMLAEPPQRLCPQQLHHASLDNARGFALHLNL